MPSESESEEYESEVEVEIEPTQTRSRTEKRTLLAEKEEGSKEESPKEDVKKLERPFRRKAGKRKEEEDEEDKESPREDDSVDLSPEADAPSEMLQSSEKRRSKRTRKMSVTPTVEKKPEDEPKVEASVKQEPGTESEEEQPKGRDFDLNQIRSELKGIEKAVKLSQDVVHQTDEKCSQLILDDKTGLIDVRCKSEEDEELQAKIVEEKVPEKTENPDTEDIYEFKEPEPFEFEVRSKRDTLLDERAGKLNRRLRIFDDVMEPKEEKLPRKNLSRCAVTNKTEGKDDTPFEGEVKKRFRRSVTKKVDTTAESKIKEIGLADELQFPPAKPLPAEPVTPQKSRPLSACEEAFDKLCESPSFHVTTKPCENQASSPLAPKAMKSPEREPLSLFSELPGEGPDDEGEDDSEDRLVISETEETETETEEPLFTYPQRHEELFSTLVSSESSAPALEPTLATSKPSPEPPQLLPMAADIFTSFGSGKNEEVTTQREAGNEVSEKANEQSSGVQMNDDVMKLLLKGGEDDEYEDDPINAAIQRVIEQSMTDEESNDMDIFSGKRSMCSIGSIQQESEVTAKQEPPAVEEPRKDLTPKETGKRKTGGRKPVLSKEFVEDTDSDSDSSDEEERLVIAKIDDEDDNMSSSSSQCSLKLHVSESSDFEMKLRLSDRDDDSKTEGEESESKPAFSETLCVTTAVEKDVEDTGKDNGPIEAKSSPSVVEGESTATVTSTDEVAASVQVGSAHIKMFFI
jgi:Ras-related protein Rab-1A